MSKIEVWKCDHTGQIFEDLSQYRQHLRELADDNRRDRIAKQQFEELNQAIQNVEHLEDMSDALTVAVTRYYRQHGYKGTITFTLDVRYSETVDNSHCCPRDGVHNFSREDDKPLDYPGYCGTILYSSSESLNYWEYRPINSVLEFLRIHTGTGSGDGRSYQYGVSLFKSDFPNLK